MVNHNSRTEKRFSLRHTQDVFRIAIDLVTVKSTERVVPSSATVAVISYNNNYENKNICLRRTV